MSTLDSRGSKNNISFNFFFFCFLLYIQGGICGTFECLTKLHLITSLKYIESLSYMTRHQNLRGIS